MRWVLGTGVSALDVFMRKNQLCKGKKVKWVVGVTWGAWEWLGSWNVLDSCVLSKVL